MAVVLPRCTLSSSVSTRKTDNAVETKNLRRGGSEKARKNGEKADGNGRAGGREIGETVSGGNGGDGGDVKKKKKRRRRRKSSGGGGGKEKEEKDTKKNDGGEDDDAKKKQREDLETKRMEALNKREEAEARLRELRERQRSAAAAAAAAAVTASAAVDDASSTVSLMRSIRLRVNAAVDRANVAQTATHEAAHRAKTNATNAATASQRGDVDEALRIDIHVDVDAAAAEAQQDAVLNERELEALHAIAIDIAAATDAAEEDEAAAKSANVFQLRGQEREATTLARSIESRQRNAASAAQRARGAPKRDVHWDDTLTSIRARLDALQTTVSASAAETHVQKLSSTIGTPTHARRYDAVIADDYDDGGTADNSSRSSSTDDAPAVT